MRDLVAIGLVVKVPDPDDGRASLLSLSERGWAVLEAVSEARRQALAEVIERLDRRGAHRAHPRPPPARGRAPRTREQHARDQQARGGVR